jgi:hypothetical protein
MLENLINQEQGLSTSLTPQQTSAYGLLNSEASGIPNFTSQAAGVANNQFNYNTNPQQVMETNALSGLNTTLSPYLSSSFLNPYSTPGFSDALKTTNSDITNQINSQFAAAGRDLSPANTTALARGLSQGEGGLIANQYNTNVNAQQAAANALFSGANTTAGGLTALQQAALVRLAHCRALRLRLVQRRCLRPMRRHSSRSLISAGCRASPFRSARSARSRA